MLIDVSQDRQYGPRPHAIAIRKSSVKIPENQLHSYQRCVDLGLAHNVLGVYEPRRRVVGGSRAEPGLP